MPLILTDPGILIPNDPRSLDFWERVAKWGTDSRIKLGPSVFSLVLDHFTEFGYPANHDFIPHDIRIDANRILHKLLSNLAVGDDQSQDLMDFHPPYLGPDDWGIALAMDCIECAAHPVAGVAVPEGTWKQDVDAVRIVGSDDPISVVCEPGALTIVERIGSKIKKENALRDHFSGTGICIFGGKQQGDIVEKITREICPRELEWHETEPDKRIREISRKIKGKSSESWIVIVVTGFISHSESGNVKKECRNRNLPLIEVRFPSGIFDTLAEMASKDSDSKSLKP